MKNWKTTLAGIATILVAIGNAVNQFVSDQPVDLPVLFTAVTAGIGLITAKDFNKTGV